MAVLADGRVLVVGGTRDPAAAELNDPVRDSWVAVGSVLPARIAPAIGLLSDGRVLVAGGLIESYDPATVGTNGYKPVLLATADVFDPVSVAWTPVPPMREARWLATGTTLPDGRVLVSGRGNPMAARFACCGGISGLALTPWRLADLETDIASSSKLFYRGPLVAGLHNDHATRHSVDPNGLSAPGHRSVFETGPLGAEAQRFENRPSGLLLALVRDAEYHGLPATTIVVWGTVAGVHYRLQGGLSRAISIRVCPDMCASWLEVSSGLMKSWKPCSLQPPAALFKRRASHSLSASECRQLVLFCVGVATRGACQ